MTTIYLVMFNSPYDGCCCHSSAVVEKVFDKKPNAEKYVADRILLHPEFKRAYDIEEEEVEEEYKPLCEDCHRKEGQIHEFKGTRYGPDQEFRAYICRCKDCFGAEAGGGIDYKTWYEQVNGAKYVGVYKG